MPDTMHPDAAARIVLATGLFGLLVLLPRAAQADGIIAGLEGFPALVMRPLVLVDHALGLIATGLFVGQRPDLGVAKAVLWLIAGSLAGFAILIWAPRFTGEWLAPLIFAAAMGGLVALAPRLDRRCAGAAVALLGVVIGANTFPAQDSHSSLGQTVAATTLAAVISVAAIGAVAARLTHPWLRIGVRITGSWIAAAAIMVLALVAAQWERFA